MVNKGENQKRIDVIPACAEVELELPVPLRFEAVDERHPKLAALLRGPLALFAISDGQPTFDRAEPVLEHQRRSRSYNCRWEQGHIEALPEY